MDLGEKVAENGQMRMGNRHTDCLSETKNINTRAGKNPQAPEKQKAAKQEPRMSHRNPKEKRTDKLAQFLQSSFSFHTAYYPFLQPKDTIKYMFSHNIKQERHAG